MKRLRYIIALLVLIPAIIASFLNYSILLNEDDINARIIAALPIQHNRYIVNTLNLQLDPDTLTAYSTGVVLLSGGVNYDATISGNITFHSNTFYLSDVKVHESTFNFLKKEDEAVVKGGIQHLKEWSKEKINNSKMDDEYKDTLIAATEERLGDTHKLANDIIESVNLPIYNLKEAPNAPFYVRLFGAMVNRVDIEQDHLYIEFSPRIIWLWILCILMALAIGIAWPWGLVAFGLMGN